MKVYVLKGGGRKEYFTSKDIAMKDYVKIEGFKSLDYLELPKPSAGVVLGLLNERSIQVLSRTPIAAWTKAKGEVYKRED